jgi:dUTP pyrophosphatase
MEIKFKKLHSIAQINRGSHAAAGFDLVATDYEINTEHEYIQYKTGVSVEIPDGYFGALYPRSSISKYKMVLCNSVGVIDSDYRGEIMVRFRYHLDGPTYKIGDKIAQLIIQKYENVSYTEVSELSDSVRGSGGFGSTGQ